MKSKEKRYFRYETSLNADIKNQEKQVQWRKAGMGPDDIPLKQSASPNPASLDAS